jgi:hypothetical protein
VVAETDGRRSTILRIAINMIIFERIARLVWHETSVLPSV